MSRLIDADELRKNLLMMECMEDVVDIVDSMPTTYDVDAVVEDMEKSKRLVSDENGVQFLAISIDKANEIVKAGGKNDD